MKTPGTAKLVKLVLSCAVFSMLLLPAVGRVADGVASSQADALKMSSGRVYSIVAMLIGLCSVVIDWMALRAPVRAKALVALVLGSCGVLFSVYLLANSAGGIGTGNGRGGTILALIIGIIGTGMGLRSLIRSKPNPVMSRNPSEAEPE